MWIYKLFCIQLQIRCGVLKSFTVKTRALKAPKNPSNSQLKLSPAMTQSYFNTAIFAAQRSPQKGKLKNAKGPGATPTAGFVASTKEPLWRCMECCGACCKLAKGLLLPLLKRSSQTLLTLTFAFTVFTTYIIVGRNARLIFFSSLFSYVVCSSCRETIKAIYGSHSKELDNSIAS